MIELQNLGEETRVVMTQEELEEMLADEYKRGCEQMEPVRKENERLKTLLRACRTLIDEMLDE